jgi:hypothetical protein
MLTARRLSTPALLALTLALTYLATATTAGAMPPPPPDDGTYANPGPSQPVTTVVNHIGSPVWTYLVVALAAAVLTLALAWTVSRMRHAHAHAASASAA